MSGSLPIYPFDSHRCIGTVTEVGPNYAKANLPDAASPEGQWLHGHRLGNGAVGEFVVVECGELGAFGRLINVKLPERERLNVEQELGVARDAHPVGMIQLLTTIFLKNSTVVGGISQYPRLGNKVYAAHPLLIKWIAEAEQTQVGQEPPLVLDLASLPSANDTAVNFTPERLFGRHCAVLGATGGGKSWTLARLIEQTARRSAKIILFDATGEFRTLDKDVRHVHVGYDPTPSSFSEDVTIPYHELTEADLFALFKPGGQSQAPKLRAAIKSLKLVRLEPKLATEGLFVKAMKPKASYDAAYIRHASVLESPQATFNIEKLLQQIDAECVWPSGQGNDYTKWGNVNEQDRSYCVTLINRIGDMLQSNDLSCIFRPDGKPSLHEVIEAFLKSAGHRVLRISLKYLPFAHNAREIVANAIGRHLLTLAREGRFREKPLLVFLDEAHQFLDKSLGDENTKYPLDSFELIAKEGRKFCLNICIATQRPRDIPEGVLSQMGTLIVHRLINDRDREVVERASGDIDRSAAAFLPTLAPGQAVIIGVDFPIPLTVQILKPGQEPDSRGPDYQMCWGMQATQPIEASNGSTPVEHGSPVREISE